MDDTHVKSIYVTPTNSDAEGYENFNQEFASHYIQLEDTPMTTSFRRQQPEPRFHETPRHTNSTSPELPARNKAKSKPKHKRQCVFGAVTAVILTVLATIAVCCVVPIIVFSGHVDSRIQAEMKLVRDSLFGDSAKRPTSSDPDVSNLRVVTNGTCYCLFTEGRNWYKAREFCLFLRGVSHFAEIRDKETNSFLMPILKAMEPNPAIWIGGSDLNAEGVFKWNTSEVNVKTFSPTQWDFGEPSHQYNGVLEHCIELSNHKSFDWVSWNDDNCDVVKPFLCQSIMTADGRCGC